jgi:5-methylcytosine-specific restriction endonuclease McrA
MMLFAHLKAAFEGRSPQWPAVEKAFLKYNPTCAVCKTKSNLNVHHKQPFHLAPRLELDPSNLITLCRPHHLLVGHLEDWKSYNVDVEKDAATWLEKISKRP